MYRHFLTKSHESSILYAQHIDSYKIQILAFDEHSNNKLKSLPEGVPGVSHEHLTLFHVSSNELTALPASLSECPSLATIYANANKIEILPQGLAHMKSLASCNLSNNFIATLGDDFLERFGEPSENDGKCAKVS